MRKILRCKQPWNGANPREKGWAAQTGNFPSITDVRAINRRLDGKVETKKEYESQSIMTNQEERSVVSHMKNTNRCNQGMSRSEVKDVMI